MTFQKYTHKERIAKLWQRVRIEGLLDCWEFQGGRYAFGFGKILDVIGRVVSVHRFVWTLVNGVIPKGLCVLHKCDNPPCCNPYHLYLGTKKDNAKDRSERNPYFIAGIKGENNPQAKLTNDNIREIRLLLQHNLTQAAIAARYKVDASLIGKIKNGAIWKHVDKN